MRCLIHHNQTPETLLVGNLGDENKRILLGQG